MKAVFVDAGAPERIAVRGVDPPQPAPDEALVEVRAISLNRGEINRLAAAADGWRPGWDIAGVVTAAASSGGPEVGAHVVGVLGVAAWAETVAVPVTQLAVLPDTISFVQAAALPVAGLTALRTLRLGRALLGSRVLVTGASGGVGRFAVQLAHRGGAHVTGIVGSEARAAGLRELGADAVVVGVGGIGTQIAVRANAFGMSVIGVDTEDKPFMPFLKRVVKPDQLDDVLPQADVVFISFPDTPKSHKMMGTHEFELMKKDSYFIAVSRGGIYDMNGLVKALDEKRLAGAGVDVTDPEPLPKGHALWKVETVIITQPMAGGSDQDAVRMIGTIKDNVGRFVEGKPMLIVVDKRKGY